MGVRGVVKRDTLALRCLRAAPTLEPNCVHGGSRSAWWTRFRIGGGGSCTTARARATLDAVQDVAELFVTELGRDCVPPPRPLRLQLQLVDDDKVKEDTLTKEELEAQRKAAEAEAERVLAEREAKRKEEEVRGCAFAAVAAVANRPSAGAVCAGKRNCSQVGR
jgi:hypothetical protein